MNFNNVSSFMSQQISALKNLEELIAHDEKQNGTHSVPKENIEALKSHVRGMRIVCDTAAALAKYYGESDEAKQTSKADEKKDASGQTEKPVPKKKNGPAKKTESPEKEEVDFDFLG